MSEMTTEQNPSEKGGNVARLVDRLSKDISLMSTAPANGGLQKADALIRKAQQNQSASRVQQGSSTAKPAAVATTSLRRVVANFAYTAQVEDELDLCEGDELAVLEDVEDGWARGRITSSANAAARGRTGLFPTNFVGPATQSPKGRAPSSETTTSATLSKSPIATGPAIGTAATFSAPPKLKDVAKVLYKYEAANPDELSLPEGALVTVLSKNCEDDGWYEGELNGQRGLFPENFVQLLPAVSVDGGSAIASPPSSAATTVTSAPPFSTNVHKYRNPWNFRRIGKSAPASPVAPPSTGDLLMSPLQPPTLPAKPNKAGLPFGQKAGTTTAMNNQPPTARFRDSMSAGPLSKGDTSIEKAKKLGEERKSMIAGLQSKLFGSGGAPLGGFAPHKPGQLGKRDSSPSSASTTAAAAETAATDEDAANSASDDNLLESVTKNRPKQTNKRPPSLGGQRLSLMQQPKPASKDSSAPSSPVIPSSSSAGSMSEKPSSPGVPVKPSKIIAFPASTVASDEHEESSTSHKSAVKALDKVEAASSTTESASVSRAEFNAFRSDANERIEELQRRVAELIAALKTNTNTATTK